MAFLRPLSSAALERSPLALRLREMRLIKELSQRELGIRIGIDPSVSSARINQYERGKNEPGFAVVKLMAEVLGVPAAYFYAEDDELAELIRRYGLQRTKADSDSLG